MIKAITYLCAASLAVLAPATSFANEKSQRSVRIADLNLASPAGRETLDRRIRAAAKSICENNVTGSRIPTNNRQCLDEAIASTRSQVQAAMRASGQNVAAGDDPFVSQSR